MTHAIVEYGPALPLGVEPREVANAREARASVLISLVMDGARNLLREAALRTGDDTQIDISHAQSLRHRGEGSAEVLHRLAGRKVDKAQ